MSKKRSRSATRWCDDLVGCEDQSESEEDNVNEDFEDCGCPKGSHQLEVEETPSDREDDDDDYDLSSGSDGFDPDEKESLKKMDAMIKFMAEFEQTLNQIRIEEDEEWVTLSQSSSPVDVDMDVSDDLRNSKEQELWGRDTFFKERRRPAHTIRIGKPRLAAYHRRVKRCAGCSATAWRRHDKQRLIAARNRSRSHPCSCRDPSGKGTGRKGRWNVFSTCCPALVCRKCLGDLRRVVEKQVYSDKPDHSLAELGDGARYFFWNLMQVNPRYLCPTVVKEKEKIIIVRLSDRGSVVRRKRHKVLFCPIKYAIKFHRALEYLGSGVKMLEDVGLQEIVTEDATYVRIIHKFLAYMGKHYFLTEPEPGFFTRLKATGTWDMDGLDEAVNKMTARAVCEYSVGVIISGM